MAIKSLNIINLRNIKAADFSTHPDLNIFFGDNGAGKTSVLESVVVLAKGRSFRSGKIASLIGPGSEAFRVIAGVNRPESSQATIGLERTVEDWAAKINGQKITQISELSHYLPLVLLEPNSHLLISGPPDERRRYLDWGVFHVKQHYLERFRRYSRALKQRNAALRIQERGMVKSLDSQVAELGKEIHQARQQQVDSLSDVFRQMLEGLSPKIDEITLSYRPGWRGESIEQALSESLDRDLERGSTQSGPHRADLAVRLNQGNARDRLSRGEQKVVAAALLLSQARQMTEAGVKPMLLLDDLSSEFDQTHLENVMSLGRQLSTQLWVTGTSRQPYTECSDGNHAMFHVKHGVIAEV